MPLIYAVITTMYRLQGAAYHTLSSKSETIQQTHEASAIKSAMPET